MSLIRAGFGWAKANVPAIVREIRETPAEALPILVSGPSPLAAEMAGALAAGGEPGLVKVVSSSAIVPGAGSILVHVIRGEPTGDDEEVFRLADRANLPVVSLVVGARPEKDKILPYVRATDVVYAAGVDERGIGEIGKRIATRADEAAPALARDLPILRSHVARSLVSRFSKRNALISAAIFVPGADMPILTLNQLRMVRRMADAYGVEERQARALMVAGVIGAGLGFRAIARSALGFIPFAGIPIRAAVAFGGTRVVGEAAIKRLEAGHRAELEKAAARLPVASESTEPGSGERDLGTND